MIKYLNLGNEKLTINSLETLKTNKTIQHDIRITNSHITNLNSVLNKKVFKKDALYIDSETLWEIMQQLATKENIIFTI